VLIVQNVCVQSDDREGRTRETEEKEKKRIGKKGRTERSRGG
jgi:hypothetical protein